MMKTHRLAEILLKGPDTEARIDGAEMHGVATTSGAPTNLQSVKASDAALGDRRWRIEFTRGDQRWVSIHVGTRAEAEEYATSLACLAPDTGWTVAEAPGRRAKR